MTLPVPLSDDDVNCNFRRIIRPSLSLNSIICRPASSTVTFLASRPAGKYPGDAYVPKLLLTSVTLHIRTESTDVLNQYFISVPLDAPTQLSPAPSPFPYGSAEKAHTLSCCNKMSPQDTAPY